MKVWHKPLALMAMTSGCFCLELFLAWVFNTPVTNMIFPGFVARTSVGMAFGWAFSEKHDNGQRLRLQIGAQLWLTLQGYAAFSPHIVSIAVATAGAALGALLIWQDELNEYAVKRITRPPPAIPHEDKADKIRARILVLEERIEPDKDELIYLREELAALEQKKGYRGR